MLKRGTGVLVIQATISNMLEKMPNSPSHSIRLVIRTACISNQILRIRKDTLSTVLPVQN